MDVRYVVSLQCDLVMRRCSGVGCEDSFWNRTGGFKVYPGDASIRYTAMTCSGCCGRSVRAKLTNLRTRLKKMSGITSEQVRVHFASCVCKDSSHAPPCPHYDYLKKLVERSGFAWVEGTYISKRSESRRTDGVWCKG